MITDKAHVEKLIRYFHYHYSYIEVDNEILEEVLNKVSDLIPLHSISNVDQVILDLARDEILSQDLAEEVVE